MDLHIRSAFLARVLFATTFRKAKFCVVTSRAILKCGCAVSKTKKKNSRNTCLIYACSSKRSIIILLSGYPSKVTGTYEGGRHVEKQCVYSKQLKLIDRWGYVTVDAQNHTNSAAVFRGGHLFRRVTRRKRKRAYRKRMKLTTARDFKCADRSKTLPPSYVLVTLELYMN
jgi:hypothetical protein